MSAELEIVLAVVGTGVALAALIASQGSAQRREIAELRQEIGNVRERLLRGWRELSISSEPACNCRDQARNPSINPSAAETPRRA